MYYCLCHDCHKYVALGDSPYIGYALTDEDENRNEVPPDPTDEYFFSRHFVEQAVKVFSFIHRHRAHRISITPRFNPNAKLEFTPSEEMERANNEFEAFMRHHDATRRRVRQFFHVINYNLRYSAIW